MSDELDIEMAEEFEDDFESPRKPPPRLEAMVLLYGIVALTFVRLHATVHGLPEPWPRFSWFAINFIALFCVPALIIKFAWRKPLSQFGLQWGEFRVWGWYFAAFFTIMVAVVLAISRTPEFHAYYPRISLARDHVGWLILSALGWLVYFFAWEFFFRGFMLFSLAPRYGGGIAILIQMIPFVMMHFGKPNVEAWSAIIAGLALGMMAFRGKSCVGTWLLHWSVAMMMDVTVILWPL